jgi:hypothetical protein
MDDHHGGDRGTVHPSQEVTACHRAFGREQQWRPELPPDVHVECTSDGDSVRTTSSTNRCRSLEAKDRSKFPTTARPAMTSRCCRVVLRMGPKPGILGAHGCPARQYRVLRPLPLSRPTRASTRCYCSASLREQYPNHCRVRITGLQQKSFHARLCYLTVAPWSSPTPATTPSS